MVKVAIAPYPGKLAGALRVAKVLLDVLQHLLLAVERPDERHKPLGVHGAVKP